MLTTKKISPIEFRLQGLVKPLLKFKLSNYNYLLNFHFYLYQLSFYFFKKYGIYFHPYKFFLLDSIEIIYCYFILFKKFKKTVSRTKKRKVRFSFYNQKKKKFLKTIFDKNKNYFFNFFYSTRLKQLKNSTLQTNYKVGLMYANYLLRYSSAKHISLKFFLKKKSFRNIEKLKKQRLSATLFLKKIKILVHPILNVKKKVLIKLLRPYLYQYKYFKPVFRFLFFNYSPLWAYESRAHLRGLKIYRHSKVMVSRGSRIRSVRLRLIIRGSKRFLYNFYRRRFLSTKKLIFYKISALNNLNKNFKLHMPKKIDERKNYFLNYEKKTFSFVLFKKYNKQLFFFLKKKFKYLQRAKLKLLFIKKYRKIFVKKKYGWLKKKIYLLVKKIRKKKIKKLTKRFKKFTKKFFFKKIRSYKQLKRILKKFQKIKNKTKLKKLSFKTKFLFYSYIRNFKINNLSSSFFNKFNLKKNFFSFNRLLSVKTIKIRNISIRKKTLRTIIQQNRFIISDSLKHLRIILPTSRKLSVIFLKKKLQTKFNYLFSLLTKQYFIEKNINFILSPLNSILLNNKNLKKEFLILYKRTKFIRTVKKNKFRFFNFVYLSLVYKNFFLLLPYFKYFLVKKKKQKKFLYNIINTYRALYYYKQQVIHGIQFLMHGTFDRHGRTRKFLYLIGKFKISSFDLPVLFDWIDFSSKYGTISLKIWIIYKPQLLNK